MKNYFAYLLTTTLLAHTSLASDRPEDVIEGFEKAMERAGVRELPSLSDYIDSLYGEDLSSSPTEGSEDPEKKQNSILDQFSRDIGLDRSRVMSREQLLQKNKEFNSHLFHTLNAAITLVSEHLDKVKNDLTFEWTYQNSGIFIGGAKKLPLDDTAIPVNLGMQGNVPTLGFIHVKQLYEIKRQDDCFDLSMVWSLLVFWKENIFPSGHYNSYAEMRAHALTEQIYDLYSRRSNALRGLPTAILSTHYGVSVINALEQIYNALPNQIIHRIGPSVFLKGGRVNVLKKKLSDADRQLSALKKVYTEPYQNFFQCGGRVKMFLAQLTANPFCIHNNPGAVSAFISDYNRALSSLNFPTAFGSRMKINVSPLDFSRLFPNIDLFSIFNAPDKVEGSPAMLPSAPTSTAAAAAAAAIEPAAAPVMAAASSSPSSAGMIPNKGSVEESEVISVPTDSIISDESYWQSEHRRHQERKRLQSHEASKPTITSYERELFTFLKEKIFHGNKGHYKPRDLQAALGSVHFSIEANRIGNGSSHTVKPTEKNPLFGADQDYFDAFFNVHMPAANAVIPHDYFSYLKSGFVKVFGLTEDYMDDCLGRAPAPSSHTKP